MFVLFDTQCAIAGRLTCCQGHCLQVAPLKPEEESTALGPMVAITRGGFLAFRHGSAVCLKGHGDTCVGFLGGSLPKLQKRFF